MLSTWNRLICRERFRRINRASAVSLRKLTIAGLLLLSVACGEGQPPEHFVLLPNREAKLIPIRRKGEVLSRTGWRPTLADIAGLEKNLSQIASLPVEGWTARIRIEHPEKYFRQYLAVAFEGQHRVYVNASCDETPPPTWRSHLYVVIDGATCYWQALYDPATKTFSYLTINARA